ncbi:MAG: hypothetical protein HOI34_07245 [Rhodospirillaceae bacterium]|jgi:hypothetical protein|nr:hypothetical protein [Rhodospirillaceae bacterium]MBT6203482.1 hypothetical protein [Rhodospirillaceae bacterium]MBT6510448.1 hypothetical protein [Rhodospirillaceae bacterium]MBT7612452.1 hypothetical protein [Rhodospirillaceae bacterium]
MQRKGWRSTFTIWERAAFFVCIVGAIAGTVAVLSGLASLHVWLNDDSRVFLNPMETRLTEEPKRLAGMSLSEVSAADNWTTICVISNVGGLGLFKSHRIDPFVHYADLRGYPLQHFDPHEPVTFRIGYVDRFLPPGYGVVVLLDNNEVVDYMRFEESDDLRLWPGCTEDELVFRWIDNAHECFSDCRYVGSGLYLDSGP